VGEGDGFLTLNQPFYYDLKVSAMKGLEEA
jgi:hypothetical protein